MTKMYFYKIRNRKKIFSKNNNNNNKYQFFFIKRKKIKRLFLKIIFLILFLIEVTKLCFEFENTFANLLFLKRKKKRLF